MYGSKKPRVLLIGNTYQHISSKAFLSKMTEVLTRLSDQVIILSGDEPPSFGVVTWTKIDVPMCGHLARRVLGFLCSQFRILQELLRRRHCYDSALVLPTSFMIPTFIMRMIGKGVVVFVAQEDESPALRILSRLNFLLSSLLVVESESVAKTRRLTGYVGKTVMGGIYVDTTSFRKEKEVHERGLVVGYVGSLEERKGISRFIEAIGIINRRNEGITFIIIGNGTYKEAVKRLCLRFDNVRFLESTTEDGLRQCYNEMRVLVLPSRSEGLPNVVLEAMACGTPVLAPPIGAIPDIVKDASSGFIMEDNSPESIATDIERALGNAHLEEIAANAIDFVKQEFSFEKALERYAGILSMVGGIGNGQ